jgi:hypothetical protein
MVMAKCAADLLDWAWGFMCNAKPFAEHLSKAESWNEATEWLEAFEKFRPEFFAWLSSYANHAQSEPEAVMGLDALVTHLGRTVQGAEEMGSVVGTIHIDTAREILEELTRLQDLEK